MTVTDGLLHDVDLDADLRRSVLKLADEELLTGHVMTAVAGWGPEIEVNLALSSMGQDELGHARVLYGLLVDEDRDRINALIWARPAGEFAAGALTRVYAEEWDDLVVRQYLYELADAERRTLLADVPALAPYVPKMVAEESFHVDFWNAWLRRTTEGDGRRRIEAALARLWPLTHDLFDLPGVGGTDVGRARWEAVVRAGLSELGLAIPADGGAPAEDGLAQMLEEMRVVYSEAPGSW